MIIKRPATCRTIRTRSPDPSARFIKPDDLFCEKHFTFEKRCAILFRHQKSHLPVAQLDSASDSDSEGRGFESCRVGQKRSAPPRGARSVFALPAAEPAAEPRKARLQVEFATGKLTADGSLLPPPEIVGKRIGGTAAVRRVGRFPALDGRESDCPKLPVHRGKGGEPFPALALLSVRPFFPVRRELAGSASGASNPASELFCAVLSSAPTIEERTPSRGALRFWPTRRRTCRRAPQGEAAG